MVINTEQAKKIAENYLVDGLDNMDNIDYGLPEIYDRYDIWNVPILYKKEVIGEIAVNAYSKEINEKLSSNIEILEERKGKIDFGERVAVKKCRNKKIPYKISKLENMVLKGRAELVLGQLPEQSIDMIFTSPPYYNARKQYSEFGTYADYLGLIRKVIRESRRVLMDGKFFIMNSSHVLVPRASRNESSSRIAVPFDIHQIFMEEGFEFVDDIIWEKPEGAGWASGRGRRFSADRNPMQYKAVPVTEYVMVYRKKPAILIDHFIRNHPDQNIIHESKIADGYEKTNVWYISPARDKRHPAIFPMELAEKVIQYYSFKNDVVLDPFGGIGTTAKAAIELGRKFVYIECSSEYVEFTRNDLNNMNTLIRPFMYQYIDYSELAENSNEYYDLNKLLRALQYAGVNRGEIENLIATNYEKQLKEMGVLNRIFDYYSILGKNNMRTTSSDFINMVGTEGIKSVVKKVFLGGNVRDTTEFITQRRLMNSYFAMLDLYMNEIAPHTSTMSKYMDYVVKDFTEATGDAKILDLWLMGLTKKGLDNIVRTEKNIEEYRVSFSSSADDTVKNLQAQYGELSGTIELNGRKMSLNWNTLLLLFLTIGAQTLSIRGSAKSMNGKMLEKLVLGTLLTTMGFEYVSEPPSQVSGSEKLFWLSNMDENERETDATVIYNKKAVSIDIGFIGKGNPEITLDKVTRFNAYKQIGGLDHDMATIIIVDTVGESSDLFNKAEQVNGTVLQMSEEDWTISFSKRLCEILCFSHQLSDLSIAQLDEYFEDKLSEIDIQMFIEK